MLIPEVNLLRRVIFCIRVVTAGQNRSLTLILRQQSNNSDVCYVNYPMII